MPAELRASVARFAPTTRRGAASRADGVHADVSRRPRRSPPRTRASSADGAANALKISGVQSALSAPSFDDAAEVCVERTRERADERATSSTRRVVTHRHGSRRDAVTVGPRRAFVIHVPRRCRARGRRDDDVVDAAARDWTSVGVGAVVEAAPRAATGGVAGRALVRAHASRERQGGVARDGHDVWGHRGRGGGLCQRAWGCSWCVDRRCGWGDGVTGDFGGGAAGERAGERGGERFVLVRGVYRSRRRATGAALVFFAHDER